MTALAGECRGILGIAVFAICPGKAVVQVTAIKIMANDLLEIGMEESAGLLKPFLVALDEGLYLSTH